MVPFRANATETLTNENAIQWKVVHLDGTDAEMRAKLDTLTAEDQYVKVVMQEDWLYTTTIWVKNSGLKYLIWDLNGHKLLARKTVTIHIVCDVLEVTDSSNLGDGQICGYTSGCTTLQFIGDCLILSRGTLKGFTYIDNSQTPNFIMTGGKCINWDSDAMVSTILNGQNRDQDYQPTLYLPIYVQTTPITVSSLIYNYGRNLDFTTNDNITNAGFAVSTSKLVSGAHNYVYGAGWDLAAGDCILEKITKKDTPYYLWYRDADDEPYQCLLRLV